MQPRQQKLGCETSLEMNYLKKEMNPRWPDLLEKRIEVNPKVFTQARNITLQF